MRFSFVRSARAALVHLAAIGMVMPAIAQDQGLGDKPQAEPPTPTPVRFDPGNMPEIDAETPALGWRFGRLSTRQKHALRRGFKLPLDALVGAKSPRDLVQAAVIAPLPDPSKPMLAVDSAGKGAAAGGGDPFAGGVAKRTAFRDDPMGALGEWLGVTEEGAAGDFSASSDPFAAGDDGGFEAGPAEEDAVSDVDDADPFAEEGDDPFADF